MDFIENVLYCFKSCFPGKLSSASLWLLL